MALQPVSGVTPLNRGNNVSFSGENRKPHSGMQPIASSAKAVPLAVLIAMSPLNKSVATDNGAYINPEPPRTEVTESTGFLFPKNRLVKAIDKKPSDIFIMHNNHDENEPRFIIKLNKLSMDGDDSNFEALECIRYTPDGKYVENRFIIKQVDIWDVTDLNDIKMLKLGGINLNTKNLNDYTPVDLENHSYNGPLDGIESKEMLYHLRPIINSPKNNGAIKMKHYIGRGLDVDFCKDYVRLLKERQAVLNVLGPSVEKTPTKVGDDMVIKNIRTNQRIFGFRKLNLDDNPNSYEALEMFYYVGGAVAERALLTEAAFTKNSSGKNVRILSGIKLPIDDLDNYEMGQIYKRVFTPEDENLGQVLENMLKGFAGAYENYGAFRIVEPSKALRASRSPIVKEKMDKFLSE